VTPAAQPVLDLSTAKSMKDFARAAQRQGKLLPCVVAPDLRILQPPSHLDLDSYQSHSKAVASSLSHPLPLYVRGVVVESDFDDWLLAGLGGC